MSKFNPAASALSEVASLLLQLAQTIPGWEGPSKTEFDIRLRNLVQKLEHAETTIEEVFLAEIVAETALEVAAL